jgi:hypothetical protein
MRSLWNLGKLSHWLEFHIFLCLIGPVLVVFHTTFKAGGVAAISLWTMLSVASSGIIGRFLYAQIPKNIQGNELTAAQITAELDRLSQKLATSPVGNRVVQTIYHGFESLMTPKTAWQATSTFFRLVILRWNVRTQVRQLIGQGMHSQHMARELRITAASFASLVQKSLVLHQVGRLFYYWHAIHIPFTVIMFITLAAHIVVTVLLGYKWIF